MLMAHPTVLRTLVERYEQLSALAPELRTGGSEDTELDPEVVRQLQDTAYTLCVSTGTRDIAVALATARAHIDGDAAAGEAGGTEGAKVAVAAGAAENAA